MSRLLLTISSCHVTIALHLVALASFVTSNATAQSSHSRYTYHGETVYPGHVVSVPLQPFSFDERSTQPSAIPVRYYAAPRPAPLESDDSDEENSEAMPPVDNNGSGPIVRGDHAVLRNGLAYAPSRAPANVKAAIWAVNAIRHKPYHWGGGHGSFHDSGYDCSGAVSFALHYAGVLNAPLPSDDLLRYGKRGRGRWITVYSRRGHTFAIIAGLRLDTTDFRYGGDVGPRWYTYGRETWGFEARHPVGL